MAETLQVKGSPLVAKTRFSTVDLPDPEGPEITIVLKSAEGLVLAAKSAGRNRVNAGGSSR